MQRDFLSVILFTLRLLEKVKESLVHMIIFLGLILYFLMPDIERLLPSWLSLIDC